MELRNDTDSFRRFIAAILPNVEARATCANRATTIGIWLERALTSEEADARERSLQRFALLTGDETVAILITLRALRAFAQAGFDRMPRRLSEDGTPSSDGPIHLERISIDLLPPNAIVTRIEGFDDRPWPDTDFTATITDSIVRVLRSVPCLNEQSSDLRGLQCDSSQDVDVDTADTALALFLGIVTLPFGIYFLEEFARAAGGGDGDGDGDSGAVGCALARLLQRPIQRPGRALIGSLLHIDFERANVTSAGFLFGGKLTPCQRFPRVTIDGPRSFAISTERASVSGIYRARTANTYGELSYRWTATHARVHSPTARTSEITFHVNAPETELTEAEVTLTVTDGDGAFAPVTSTVRINLTPISPGRPRTRPPRDT